MKIVIEADIIKQLHKLAMTWIESGDPNADYCAAELLGLMQPTIDKVINPIGYEVAPRHLEASVEFCDDESNPPDEHSGLVDDTWCEDCGCHTPIHPVTGDCQHCSGKTLLDFLSDQEEEWRREAHMAGEHQRPNDGE